MLTTILVLLALGGVITQSAQDDLGGCLYTPDANGHAVVPDGVTSIGEEAFRNCVSLISIALPESLTSIGWGAFRGATSLTSVSFPESYTSIDPSAFRNAISLASVSFPESLTSIGNMAFSNTPSLVSLSFPKGLTSIGESAFGCCGDDSSVPSPDSSLVSVSFPDGLTSIGDYAFNGHSTLSKVYVPVGCSVGVYAFHFGWDDNLNVPLGETPWMYGRGPPPPPPLSSSPPVSPGVGAEATSGSVAAQNAGPGLAIGLAIGGCLLVAMG